jgi:hypothetical protein
MTITELIQELEGIRTVLGDLPVALHNFDIDYGDSWGALTEVEVADLSSRNNVEAVRSVVLSNDGLVASGVWDVCEGWEL